MKDNDFSVNFEQMTPYAVIEKARALLARMQDGEISIGAFHDALGELLDAAVLGDQPQGEPVAWLAQAVGKGGEVYRNTASTNEPTMRDIEIAWGQGVIDRFTIVIKPLYAEQPAPVAVAMPGRRPIPTGIESLAKQVYQSWESQPGFVPWVEGGNSLKQDEARQIASRTFELALANQVGSDQ